MAIFLLSEKLPGTDWPMNPWVPSLRDILSGGLPRDDQLIDRITAQLKSTPVVIHGLPNRGKTFLAYLVAGAVYEASPANERPVLYYALADDLEPEDLDHFTARSAFVAEHFPRDHAIRVLYLVDDCHNQDPDLIQRVIDRVQPPRTSLLLISRGTRNELPAWHEELVFRSRDGEDPSILFEPSNQYVLSVVKTFIARSGCDASEEEHTDFVDRFGHDLAYVVHGLRSWEKACDALRLGELDSNVITAFAAREYGISPLRRDRCHLLELLATLGRLELSLPADHVPDELQESMRDLLDEGWVRFDPSFQRYSLRDSKTCDIVLRALAEKCGLNLVGQAEIMVSYARTTADRAYGLLRALTTARDADGIKALFNDRAAAAALQSALVEHGTGSITYQLSVALQCLRPLDRPIIIDRLSGDVIQALTEYARGKSARTLRRVIDLVGGGRRARDIFVSWEPTDWSSTVRTSTLNATRRLLNTLHHSRMSSAAQALGSAIVENLSRVDFGSMTLGKRGLAQMFHYLEEEAPDACAPFLQWLSASERLGPLIEASELDTVNYWLSRFVWYNRLDLLDEFLAVNTDSIRQRLATDGPTAQSFWLLWHTYLAGGSVDDWSLSSSDIDELIATVPVELRSAAVGLMDLLSVPVEDATAFLSLRGIADQVAAESSPTVVALSLRAALAHHPPNELNDGFAALDLDALQVRWSSIEIEAVRSLFDETFELLRAAVESPG